MRFYQVLPVLSFGDAIGNHTLALERILNELGYETGIYAEVIDSRLPKGSGKQISEMPELGKKDIVLYHLSTGSELNYMLTKWNCTKILEYHNITPPAFFLGYNMMAKRNSANGYEEAAYLADKVDYCIADSEYNKLELRRMGYQQTIGVIPILIPFQDYEKRPSEEVVKRYNDGKTNIIFTGRIVPNKKQEDIIKAFFYYKKNINSDSRLFLVGKYSGMERYYNNLRDYVDMLKLEDVYFTGHIKFDEILAYYRVADIFVCLSEHEGFCVPLLEAMKFEVPIIAYDSTAVSGTLGKGGMILTEKNAKVIAELMNQLMVDDNLREQVINYQNIRLKDFSYEHIKQAYMNYFKKIIGDR